MTDTAPLPIIRLRPNAAARAIRFGFPWVYDNELVMDRRSRKIDAGTLGILQDADRNDLALVAINPNSKIVARVLDSNINTMINADWFRGKFQRALNMRSRLFDRPFYRLIHAESDGLPGVIIDRFDDHFVVQPNAAWADCLLDTLVDALVDVTGARVVIKNASGRTRGLEGLDDVSLVLRGDMPSAPMQVPMNGAIYMADLAVGQKTGLFFDQRPNHAFAASLSNGARVLDVFSHVGGFSLAAFAAGADHAVAVDGSAAALDLAMQGAAAMGVKDMFETLRGDAFDVMTRLAEESAQFDVVICDPPAFASSKPALEAGLRAYERVARLAAQLVVDGGYLGLCSCSHAADLAKFRAASIRGIGRAGRKSALIHTGFAGPDHPLHPQLAESGYLKSLFFRL
jgi:23S rRNA (cytosine1962-C5)-methyltransferase